MSLSRHAVVAATCFLSLSPVRAGEQSDIRGIGMARTSVATSRGLESVGINPANLAVTDSSTVTFTILPVGVHFGSDFLDYALYTQYFTGVQTDTGRVGRYLTDEDKKEIINSFRYPLGRITAGAEATIFGITYRVEGFGAAALTITERVGGFARVPRDYAEFVLTGNPTGSSYTFEGTSLMASWIREYALSLGGSVQVSFLQSFAVGAAAKLVHGFGYYEVERFNTSLTTDAHATLTGSVDFLSRGAGMDPEQIVNSYRLLPEVAGKGLGLDLGVRGDVNDFVSFAVSVTDIGSIKWSGGTQEKYADTTIVVDDPLQEEQRKVVENVLKGKSRATSSFSTSLPTTLRLGIAMDMRKLSLLEHIPGGVLFELDYNQSVVETPFSSTVPRVSAGVEYTPLRWLPLRSGVSFGGTDHVNVGLGFGITLRTFQFELASENVSWLFAPRSFSRGSLAVGARLSF